MNTTLTDDDCHVLFNASQDAWNRLDMTKSNRLYQLEILYLTLKDGDPTDSIMRAIAILDEQEIELRKKYSALVKAHAAAVDALPGNPPLNDAQQIY